MTKKITKDQRIVQVAMPKFKHGMLKSDTSG